MKQIEWHFRENMCKETYIVHEEFYNGRTYEFH